MGLAESPAQDADLFECSSVFGDKGSKSWLIGIDLTSANLHAIPLTVASMSDNGMSFDATNIEFREQIEDTPTSYKVASNDPLTGCLNLSQGVGGEVRLHWEGSKTAQLSAVGGGISELGCFYGHVDDPLTNVYQPVLLCASQAKTSETDYEVTARLLKTLTSDRVVEYACKSAEEEGKVKFSDCVETMELKIRQENLLHQYSLELNSTFTK